MRIKEHVLETIRRRARASAELTGCLIENPNCMDGEPQKEKAYKVAIQYFTEKQEDSKMPGYVSCIGRAAIELQVLTECYDDADGEMKKVYARKIARYLVGTQEHYLMRVPDEIKEVAFQIAIKYLEEQRDA